MKTRDRFDDLPSRRDSLRSESSPLSVPAAAEAARTASLRAAAQGVFARMVGMIPRTWVSPLIPLIKSAANGRVPAVTAPKERPKSTVIDAKYISS